MKKIRLIFYWGILALLMFLYYVIIDALYLNIGSDSSERGLVPQLIAVINVPLNLVLGVVRLWLLKPIGERQRLFDISHFAIPLLIAIACFADQYWIGIILSVLAGVLIGYEFIRSITKMDSLLFGRK